MLQFAFGGDRIVFLLHGNSRANQATAVHLFNFIADGHRGGKNTVAGLAKPSGNL